MPNAAPAPAGATLWRTCIREVLFLGDGHAHDTAAPVIADGDAYALLIEIVSGLRSPLIGETEIQAQFKSFLATLDPLECGGLLRLGQRVLADAKRIRQKHLQGFGAHSYGRLVRAHVADGSRVVLVGAGALASEIRATLAASRPDLVLDQWARRETDGQAVHLLATARARSAQSLDPVSLVIAAPASPGDLADVIALYPQIVAAIDLRAADERTPLSVSVPVVTLDDLFDEARALGGAAALRVDAARRDILNLSREYEQREELHPFGWDDVCA